MPYEIAHHAYGSSALIAALRTGWEPFGVTGDIGPVGATVWVRRGVTVNRERDDPSIGPTDPLSPQRARDMWDVLTKNRGIAF
jgi:hypothetical protein